MRLILFVTLVLIPYAVEQVVFLRFAANQATQEQRQPARRLAGYGWAYLWDLLHFLVLAAGGYRSFSRRHDSALRRHEQLGYLIFLAGVTVRILALRELGSFWSGGVVIQEGHQVIDSGPYRTMRHPLHLGTWLQITGLALLSPIWLAAPTTVIALIQTLLTNRFEDKALLQELGEPYRSYYQRTWDLVDLCFSKVA